MKIENIKKQILDRIYLKNLSISNLERKAGLKKGTARNIVSNISQNPTIDTLAAIASVLNCKVDDLISSTTTDINIKASVEEDYKLEVTLFWEIVEYILSNARDKNISLTLNDTISVIKQAYIFLLTKKNKEIDREFIGWLIDNKLKESGL